MFSMQVIDFSTASILHSDAIVSESQKFEWKGARKSMMARRRLVGNLPTLHLVWTFCIGQKPIKILEHLLDWALHGSVTTAPPTCRLSAGNMIIIIIMSCWPYTYAGCSLLSRKCCNSSDMYWHHCGCFVERMRTLHVIICMYINDQRSQYQARLGPSIVRTPEPNQVCGTEAPESGSSETQWGLYVQLVPLISRIQNCNSTIVSQDWNPPKPIHSILNQYNL